MAWKEIIKRYDKNPVLRPEDMPEPCFAVYNCGAAKFKGKYLLLTRMETLSRLHYVWVALSDDGYNFKPEPKPVEFTARNMNAYKEYADYSFYDPRVNIVEGEYYVTYAATSNYHGCRIGIARTKDFKKLEHVSFPMHISNRNAVLFPEKIGGEYVMLHRPVDSAGRGDIWIAHSSDLEYWGKVKCVAKREGSGRWEWAKIGPGAPPIKTREGWLLIYHGTYTTCQGTNYCMGAMLLDLKDPSKIVARSRSALMRPEADYEFMGQVPNVVFPCGAILEDNGEVKIYYGAADNFACVATAKLDDLIKACREL